jgi:hypothetical protein
MGNTHVQKALCYPVMANAIGGLVFENFLSSDTTTSEAGLYIRIIQVRDPSNVDENRAYVRDAAAHLDRDARAMAGSRSSDYAVYKSTPRTVLIVATHGDSSETDWSKWITAPVWRVITLLVKPVPPAFLMLPYDMSRSLPEMLEEARGLAEIQKLTPKGVALAEKWDTEYVEKFPPPPEPPKMPPAVYVGMGRGGRR